MANEGSSKPNKILKIKKAKSKNIHDRVDD